MNSDDFRRRTRAYALSIIRFVEALPRSRATDVISRQLLKCGTSVGANYRAAARARSPADFIAKLGIVEEEADECLYWLELLVAAEIASAAQVAPLVAEGNEILAMTVASINTARRGTR
jgi:four helix bundle protein